MLRVPPGSKAPRDLRANVDQLDLLVHLERPAPAEPKASAGPPAHKEKKANVAHVVLEALSERKAPPETVVPLVFRATPEPTVRLALRVPEARTANQEPLEPGAPQVPLVALATMVNPEIVAILAGLAKTDCPVLRARRETVVPLGKTVTMVVLVTKVSTVHQVPMVLKALL